MALHSYWRTVPFYVDPSGTPSPHNSSFLYPSRAKRHRSASCSMHGQSPRHSSSPVTPNPCHGSNKPVILDSSSDPTPENENTRSDKDPNRLSQTRSCNSVFGFRNRCLWRKILFPSRKVRNIIMLNVTTFIYGNLPLFPSRTESLSVFGKVDEN